MSFLLPKAVRDLMPDRPFAVEHSIGTGYYCNFTTGPRDSNDEPPVSDDEIAAMDEAEAKKALAAVSKARPYAPDDATKERLKREFTLLMAQLKKVKEGAS